MHLESHFRRWFGVAWLCGFFLGGVSVQGQDATEKASSKIIATNQASLAVELREHAEKSNVRGRFAFIDAGGIKTTFVVLEGLGFDAMNPHFIKMASKDHTCLITARWVSDLTNLNPEAARVQAVYPGASVTAQDFAQVTGRTVPQVDFDWAAGAGIKRKGRTVSLAAAGGMMEFTLLASPESFDSHLYQLNLITSTFRASATGKFEYVMGSEYP